MDGERWQRLRAVVEDAAGASGAARVAIVDAAGLSTEDRAEVESLLHAHDQEPDFLEAGVDAAAAELLGPAADLFPGQALGQYEVIRELGRGGMAVVYLARDHRLGREVAIKVLPEPFDDTSSRRERLQREARSVATIGHPGIAQVFALEETPSGISYIVSEYVRGRTLRAAIADGPLPVDLALRTARDVADAMVAAHARGVVHRDLSPDNVMLTHEGHTKVVDFGLAQVTGPQQHDRLTRAGLILGTPGYMSPEQLLGREAGPAADIHALGLLLYEMLAGYHAFSSDRDDLRALAARILDGEPNALPEAVLAQMPLLDEVIRRCLEKQPEDRYPSMEAVREALMQVTPGRHAQSSFQPVVPPRGGSAGWWQVHQVIISALFITLLLPIWLAGGSPVPAWLYTATRLVAIVAAAAGVTARLHLVFAARVHRAQLARARRRAEPWTRVCDLLMVAALLSAAAAAVLTGRTWLAAILSASAAGILAAFLFIEPSTTEAAFGRERDDGR